MTKLNKGVQKIVDIMREREWHIVLEFSVFHSKEYVKLFDKHGYHKTLSCPSLSRIKKMIDAEILIVEKIDSTTKKLTLTEKYKK